jgi:hypothetical protein
MRDSRPLAVGDIFHNYAGGAFGRDHYDCVKIEAAGPDWIVARDADGDLSFAGGEESLRRLISVRDTGRCEDVECPVGKNVTGLTVPGGY